AEAVAGQWIPYRMNAAGRSAFGQSLSDAWREWGDSLGATYAHLDADLRKLGPITEPEHLTRGARWTTQPRVAADGTLAYAKSDGRSDPHLALRVVGDAGRADPALDADIRRVRVNGIVSFDWLPDGRLLVSQLEYQDPYRLHNDLYVVERDGSTRRLTRGARLGQPAAEPGGRTAVAVQEGEGTNALVRVDLSTGAVTRIVPPVPGEHWAYPSVSPDGRWIAATRWRTGGYHDVLVLDAASGAVRSEVTRDRALDHAPSWSSDGRWIVWASDRTGILNVLGAEIDPETGAAGLPRLLTNVRTGATYPSVSPDGLLYFSVYHADGWDVARTPFRPVDASEAPPAGPRFTTATSFEDGTTDAPVEGYSPFPSLMPRYWSLSLRPPVRT